MIATRFVSGFQSAFGRLLDYPLSAPGRDHLAPGLRALVHGSYAAYYQVMEQEVVILRVLHGARDIDAIAQDGGLS
jgi:toxin ParE1/3/4